MKEWPTQVEVGHSDARRSVVQARVGYEAGWPAAPPGVAKFHAGPTPR